MVHREDRTLSRTLLLIVQEWPGGHKTNYKKESNMKQQKSRNNPTSIHWVGIDVAKATFDAGLVRRDQRYPDTPLREIPATSFEHSPEGVKTFLA